MASILHWSTVDDLLKDSLLHLMGEPLFEPFCLVGGTALSLHLGHRKSVDIDLFTGALYGSIDFAALHAYLVAHFPYVSPPVIADVGMGQSYLVGESAHNAIKLDLYYNEPFFQDPLVTEGVRIATVEEIIAMKIDVVQRGGRKKDFWDLHRVLDDYSIAEMLALHEARYPYWHDEELIRKNFIDFNSADDDLDPICLLGKDWGIIKLDIFEAVTNA